MEYMKISRYQGLGNDFLIAFVEDLPNDPFVMARHLCDRKNSIGADGLIFGTPSTSGDAFFTLFNSDGSEAEVSGNGLACFGYAIHRNDMTKELITIETATTEHKIWIKQSSNESAFVEASLNAPNKGPAFDDLKIDLGGAQHTRVASVDVGNPHLVIEVKDVEGIDLGEVGPKLEAFFMPVGCNIHLVAISDDQEIQVRHWERGVGLTEACGSGAVASAWAAHQWGAVSDDVQVGMPGGTASVSLGERPTYMCETIYEGEFEV